MWGLTFPRVNPPWGVVTNVLGVLGVREASGVSEARVGAAVAMNAKGRKECDATTEED
jgi:hypothetical protein